VRVRAATAPALGAVRRNGGAGPLRSAAPDRRADHVGEAIDAQLFIVRIALGANLDAFDERAMIVLAQLRSARGNRVGRMDFKFLIERQHALLFCP
jgi:hypothetical protein